MSHTAVSGGMLVADAQREVRSVFVNGAVGQGVSGAIWLASASAATWGSVRAGVLVLVLGGAFIFPVTQFLLRLAGRAARLDSANPLNGLAMQVAFIVPLMLPVVGGAALYDINWFYPAMMVVVGAHYLPFVFLYGMRSYAVLAAALIAGGVALGFGGVDSFTPGGWTGGLAMCAFAVWAGATRKRAGREARPHQDSAAPVH